MSMRALGLSLALCMAPLLSSCAHDPGASTDAQIAQRAADLVARQYPADGPGAAVLVARGDTIIYRAARGEADVEGNVPLQPDAVFRLGSVTKQFAAAGLLKLVEEGRVGLDDPLSRFLPNFPRGGDITIRQLLNHTSGVANYTAIPGYMDELIKRDLTTAQMIDVFDDLPLDFAPGERWSYSNSGYVLVGAVIEAASGMPWYEYLDRSFFQPLGMRHTGYGHDPRFIAEQVHGYSLRDGAVVPMAELSMTQPHAAGALVSNVDDLLIWNRALHEGRVLSNPLYVQMITPAGAAAQGGANYGFGIVRSPVRTETMLEHGGGIFGFNTSLDYVQGPDITVVVLENNDSDNGGPNASSVARRLAAIALNDPYPEMIAVPVEQSVLQSAEAVYQFDGDIRRTLRVVDGQLTAQREGRARIPLTAVATDDFLYEDGLNRIKLVRDASGAITGVRYYANGDGAGDIGTRTTLPLPPLETPGVALPRAALERLVGVYASSQLEMTVFIDGETLRAQLPGQPPVTLRANSATQFAVLEAEATLDFSEGDGPPAQATITQGGRQMVLTRRN